MARRQPTADEKAVVSAKAGVELARTALLTAAEGDDAEALDAARAALANAKAAHAESAVKVERAHRVADRARCIEAAETLERAQDVADWQTRAAHWRGLVAEHDARIAAIDKRAPEVESVKAASPLRVR